MNNFIIKSLVFTSCAIALLSFIPVQKYEFPSEKVRCNKFTGEVEFYSDYFGVWKKAG